MNKHVYVVDDHGRMIHDEYCCKRKLIKEELIDHLAEVLSRADRTSDLVDFMRFHNTVDWKKIATIAVEEVIKANAE